MRVRDDFLKTVILIWLRCKLYPYSLPPLFIFEAILLHCEYYIEFKLRKIAQAGNTIGQFRNYFTACCHFCIQPSVTRDLITILFGGRTLYVECSMTSSKKCDRLASKDIYRIPNNSLGKMLSLQRRY